MVVRRAGGAPAIKRPKEEKKTATPEIPNPRFEHSDDCALGQGRQNGCDCGADARREEQEAGLVTSIKLPKPLKDGGFQFTQPEDPRLPVGFLSPSSAAMYLDCGHAFYLRYVLGLKMPPSVAMVEGISHHHWLEHNNTCKIKSGDDITVADALDVFQEDWKKRSKDTSDGTTSLRDLVSKRAKPLIERYMRKIAPALDPESAEQQADIVIAGVPMMVKIDVTTKKGVVLDYKVSSRKKSKKDVVNSLQLPLYVAVKKAKRAGLVSMVHTKNEVEQETHPFSPSELSWAGEIVASVADSIGKGAFPKAKPDSWKCSERFCGYWHMCRGAKAPSSSPATDMVDKLKASIHAKRAEIAADGEEE